MSQKRKRFTRREFLNLVTVTAGGTILAACAPTGTPVAPTSVPAKAVTPPALGPTQGGALVSTLPTQGIRGFKSWQDTTGNETHVYTLVYDTLVRYDDQYNLEGGLFESWETEDAQTWTFKVREGEARSLLGYTPQYDILGTIDTAMESKNQ